MSIENTLLKIIKSNEKLDYNVKDVLSFATIYDGNIAHIDTTHSMDIQNAIFKVSNKEIYDSIISAYNSNMEFYKKYSTEFETISEVDISSFPLYFYYNNKSKQIYAIPEIHFIIFRTYKLNFAGVPLVVKIVIEPDMLSKPDTAVDSFYKYFHLQVFGSFIELPLNKYIPEELLLFDMQKI